MSATDQVIKLAATTGKDMFESAAKETGKRIFQNIIKPQTKQNPPQSVDVFAGHDPKQRKAGTFGQIGGVDRDSINRGNEARINESKKHQNPLKSNNNNGSREHEFPPYVSE